MTVMGEALQRERKVGAMKSLRMVVEGRRGSAAFCFRSTMDSTSRGRRGSLVKKARRDRARSLRVWVHSSSLMPPLSACKALHRAPSPAFTKALATRAVLECTSSGVAVAEKGRLVEGSVPRGARTHPRIPGFSLLCSWHSWKRSIMWEGSHWLGM
jgi:hypothetical protein